MREKEIMIEMLLGSIINIIICLHHIDLQSSILLFSMSVTVFSNPFIQMFERQVAILMSKIAMSFPKFCPIIVIVVSGS